MALRTRLLPGRWLVLLLTLLPTLALTQPQPPAYPGLVQPPHAPLAVYCTPGAEVRAAVMAARCADALAWLKPASQLGFTPRVTLLVLGPADWPRFASPGEPYGMPHTAAGNTLVVAAGTNAVWEGTLPPLASLPPAQADALTATYRNASGQLSLEKLFDLLALHELAHLYYRQAGLGRPRYWLEELFCNLLLHTYIASREPTQLPALEVYPEIVVAGTDRARLRYTTLADFDQQYNRMEREQPQNYGWYQCRLHRAAARIYNAPQGSTALLRLWQALRGNPGSYTDAELAAFLAARVGPELARVQTAWLAP